MESVLTTEHRPKSIFKFCKENMFKESEFYSFFGSFEVLQKEIWTNFFLHTIHLSQEAPEYEASENKEKMLIFFYTFFEMLTANRSYVLFALEESIMVPVVVVVVVVVVMIMMMHSLRFPGCTSLT